MPELDFLDLSQRPQPGDRAGHPATLIGDRQHAIALCEEAVRPHPRRRGSRLPSQPVGQPGLGHEPQRTAVGGSGVQQELGGHEWGIACGP